MISGIGQVFDGFWGTVHKSKLCPEEGVVWCERGLICLKSVTFVFCFGVNRCLTIALCYKLSV